MKSDILKNSQWALEFAGLDNYYMQSVDFGPVSYQQLRHGTGSNGPDKKRPGKIQFGDITVERFAPADITSPSIHDHWRMLALALLGNGRFYLQQGFFKKYNGFNQVVERWVVIDAWIMSIDPQNHVKYGDADNSIDQIVISADKYFPDPIQQIANLV